MLVQASVMLIAITNESLWIDEFWTAGFVLKDNLQDLIKQWSNPQIALTPLHYLYFYFWGIFFHSGEMLIRLANLPLFVLGQLSLFLALRAYPKRFGYLLLFVSALHPMVWQYANEARPYMMMYAGSEMILAYILHIHVIRIVTDRVNPLFSAIFVLGSIMLLGASMLGGFWVFVALAYVVYYHHNYLNWHYLKQGVSFLLLVLFLVALVVLSCMYVWSVFQGASASKLSPTTAATLLFDVYELLGLSGVGPGRLDLREAGLGALGPYVIWLALASVLVVATLLKGLQSAVRLLGMKRVVILAAASLFPIVVVVSSGIVMHWRVLGRHLIASLPVLNILFALGLVGLLDKSNGRTWPIKKMIALSFLVFLIYSSFAMRFAERHRKDDYKGASAIARQEVSQGNRVWWAADSFGAGYYGLVEINMDAIFTGPSKAKTLGKVAACGDDDQKVQLVANNSTDCLENFKPPNVIMLSKPQTFDSKGDIAAYLNAHGFLKVQSLPAFTIWRPMSVPSSPGSSTLQGVH